VPFVGLLFRKIKNYPFLNFIKHLMQKIQRGEIGLVISTQSFVPYSSKAEDVAAAQRMMDFWLGWLVKLTYPILINVIIGVDMSVYVSCPCFIVHTYITRLSFDTFDQTGF
jgi:hypothetical protein